MKTDILILLAFFSIASCHGKSFPVDPQKDETCGKQISIALGHINNFYFTKQVAYLDSALQILKGIKSSSLRYTYIILNDEAHVYFLKKDFASALATLDEVPASIFPFPAFKDVFKYKIKAKEAETKGDTINQKKYFHAISIIYQHYLDENYQAFAKTLSQSNSEAIVRTQESCILEELYFYISQTDGVKNAIKQLESYKNKVNGNSLYFNELIEDIKSKDAANTMGIMLH